MWATHVGILLTQDTSMLSEATPRNTENPGEPPRFSVRSVSIRSQKDIGRQRLVDVPMEVVYMSPHILLTDEFAFLGTVRVQVRGVVVVVYME